MSLRIDSARPVTPASSRSAGSVSQHSLLSTGSKGAEVKQLQQLLKKEGFLTGPVNGRFSARTDQAVRAYQQAKGLQVDGLVGQQTWGSFLGQKLPPGTNLLKAGSGTAGGAAPAPSSPGRDSFGPATGPQKTVTAYVNGRPQQINVVSVGGGEYLRADAAAAFKAMQASAARDGVNLSATSGFRSMGEQQALYQKYLNGTGNLAARPGYSNHQDGIAMDIGGINGRGTAADSWLRAHAAQFGFRNLPAEFWHYDFVG